MGGCWQFTCFFFLFFFVWNEIYFKNFILVICVFGWQNTCCFMRVKNTQLKIATPSILVRYRNVCYFKLWKVPWNLAATHYGNMQQLFLTFLFLMYFSSSILFIHHSMKWKSQRKYLMVVSYILIPNLIGTYG